MNELLKIGATPASTTVAHSVMGYDKSNDALVSELPIPLFLDSLALKIAEIPAEDPYGAASYELSEKQTEVFRFLLGLEVEKQQREYFIESTRGVVPELSETKRKAVTELAQFSPRLRARRTERISESELVVPTLRLLEAGNADWLTTADLIKKLSGLFAPTGTDAKILDGRSDTYFSQKVRNIISHRNQESSFISKGMAEYNPSIRSLRISEEGRRLIRSLRS